MPPLPTCLSHLRVASLRALDDGLAALHRHDSRLSPADLEDLRDRAGDCLREVNPLKELLERFDCQFGALGLGLLVCALGAGLYVLGIATGISTSVPGASTAVLNAALAAASCLFVFGSMSVMTQRIESAVSLATEVLAALPSRSV